MSFFRDSALVVVPVVVLMHITASVWFLIKTIVWLNLSFWLVSGREGSSASLVDIKLANFIRFNGFSVSLVLASVIFLALAIYSLYVSTFGNEKHNKRLAYVSAFTFISSLVFFVPAAPYLTRFEDESLLQLRGHQESYKWDIAQNSAGPVAETIKRATIVWDLVQENLECCGFKSPSDWAAFEPKSLERRDLLPRSCCQDLFNATIQGDGYCRPDLPHWTTGCSHQVHSLITQVLSMISSVIYFSMLFSLFASVIAIYVIHQWRETEERNGVVRPGAPYQVSSYGTQRNNTLVITEQHSYFYPGSMQPSYH